MEWIFIVIGAFVVLPFLWGFFKSASNGGDKEFNEKNYHMKNFRMTQELLVSGGMDTIPFSNEKAKMKYLHFMVGAIDQLSRTISDDKRSEEWFYLQSLAIGVGIFQPEVMEKHISSYGRPDGEFYDIGQKGWEAMRIYIMSSTGEVSEEEFQKSCNAFSRIYYKD